jgi:hypothetical protein
VHAATGRLHLLTAYYVALLRGRVGLTLNTMGAALREFLVAARGRVASACILSRHARSSRFAVGAAIAGLGGSGDEPMTTAV